MNTMSDLIESLLLSEEDVSLDFKREQYAFESADKDSKSELLKDILAFVNAFRRADAYILIGVEEVRGGKSTVVGVETHLDDAKLQQFVNSKTQAPVTFSYRQFNHDDLPVGVIHIPMQPRPIYTIVNYGKVKKEKVYIRRGSSTDIAKPEEIARMGVASVELPHRPNVRLHLVERSTGKDIGDQVVIKESTWFEVPSQEDLPDYRPGMSVGTGIVQAAMFDPMVNLGFYRELATYLQTETCFGASLELENTSENVIHDARLEVELPDPDLLYMLMASEDRPSMPRKRNDFPNLTNVSFGQRDLHVEREGDVWKVECRFGKIQPHARVRLEEDLLIGSRHEQEIKIEGKVYGDNIGSPISVSFVLHFLSGARQVTVEQIQELAGKL